MANSISRAGPDAGRLDTTDDMGLLSERYDVPALRLTGNLPQALMHLAAVSTAPGLSGPVLDRGGG